MPEPSTAAARRLGGGSRPIFSGIALAGLLLAGAGAWAQNPNVFPIELVGATAGAQSVTVTSSAAGGTVSSVKVLTMGVTGGDFAAGGGASTCLGATLAPSATCTESVTFSPSAPGLRMGAVVLLDSNGKVVGTGYVSGVGKGGLGVLAPGNELPVAGDGQWTEPKDGSPATQAELNLPAGVALDGAGNLFIADSMHNRVRLVCSSNPPAYVSSCTGPGIIETIAGNGSPAYSGDGGLASAATLNAPNGVAVDGAGNVYIADTANNVIRMISAATGDISTVAGNNQGTICTTGGADAVGDGCPATQATLNAPWSVTVDASGNLYIADTYNQRIREVSVSTGTIATIAGTGYTTSNGEGDYNGDGIQASAAELNFPYAAALDLQGNLYIADSANNRIRMVCASATSAPAYVTGCGAGAGTILTVAGTGVAGGISSSCPATSGAANATQLSSPSGVALDPAGNLYIADTQNNAIRKVSATTGQLSNLVQNTCGDYETSAGTPGRVTLYGPIGLTVDPNGDLYVADYYDMIVREIQSNVAFLDFLSNPTRQGSQSAPFNQTVENDGNDALDLTAINPDANSQLGAGSSCTTGTPYLAVDGDCTIAAVFAPSVAGDPLRATIAITDEAEPSVTGANSPLNIELVGNAEAVNSTTTTVTSAPDPSGFGQSVTFTITVTTGSGTGNLTGTVSLSDTFNGTTTPLTAAGGLTLALNAAGTTGVAAFAISTLGVGQHSIVASYSGDTGHFASSSTDNGVLPDVQIVQEGTTTTLQSSLNPSNVGQNVTFTATVTSAGGGITPDGTVAFMDGANTLATQPLTGTGVSATATFATSTLTNGMHQITAAYSGDAGNEIQPSTSAALHQDVQAADTMAVTSSPNPSNYGTQVTFTATIPSSATNPATGTVTFLDNGAKIGTGTLAGNPAAATFQTSSLVVGTHAITATYPGDAYNSAASSAATPYDQTVNQAQTSTTVAASPNPGIAGMPERIAATVSVVAGSAMTTGTVTFTSGTTTLGSAALNATGTATITPTLAPGTYNIVAAYGGDANDEGSTSSPALALAVNQATTTTTVSASPNPALVDASITFTAKVTGTGGTPTGAVNFLAGSTVVGSANLVSGTATFTDTTGLGAGTYAITADYLGDTNDAASNSAAASETVGTIPTTTDLGSSTTGGSNPQVILIATVLASASGPTPTGTITFNNGATELGSATLDAGGVATLVPSLNGGVNYSITAAYSGDANHSPSTSQAVTIAGTAQAFNLTLSPTSVSMATSQNANVNVNLTSNGGFSDTIGLGCGSLPTGVTCHFSSVSVNLPANGTASAQLTIDTNSPLSGGSTAMNRSEGRGMSLAGLFLPLSVWFGWMLWRLRRRHGSLLTMALVVAFSAAALLATGCNGFSMGSAAPGTYTIQVIGTGTSSNVVHYQNETVTITK